MKNNKNKDMTNKLFLALDKLVSDMAVKTTVKNEYPVNGKLFSEANDLLMEFITNLSPKELSDVMREE